MSTATLTRHDLRVRDAVMRQLEWDPQVDASAIGVAAKDGSVTLTGYIDTYSGKLAAERAAKRVAGVRAVANDIDVRLRLDRTDSDIAADAAKALELRSTIPEGVQAIVHNGHVTLTGHAAWLFQKQSAERAVSHIRGVRGVLNHITVRTQTVARDVKRLIVKALHDNANVDARHISVGVTGGQVTLTGTAGSWLQRDAAERAAADAQGVVSVDNQIVIEPPFEYDSVPTDDIC